MSLIKRVKAYWEAAPCGTEDTRLSGLEPNTREWFERIEDIRYRQEPMIHSAVQFTRHKGKRVLEIGVGAGTDHLQWARAGVDLYGVDLTEAAIETTRQRLALYGLSSKLQTVNAEKLPFDDGFFDIVYSWGVIHHSETPEKIIAEAHRVLKAGGSLIGMFYSKVSIRVWKLWARHSVLKGKWDTPSGVMARHMESEGTQCYTKAELHRLFSGFSDVKIQKALTPYDMTYLPKPLQSWLPDSLGFFSIVTARK